MLLIDQVGDIVASTAQLKLLLPESSIIAVSLSSLNDPVVIDDIGSNNFF